MFTSYILLIICLFYHILKEVEKNILLLIVDFCISAFSFYFYFYFMCLEAMLVCKEIQNYYIFLLNWSFILMKYILFSVIILALKLYFLILVCMPIPAFFQLPFARWNVVYGKVITVVRYGFSLNTRMHSSDESGGTWHWMISVDFIVFLSPGPCSESGSSLPVEQEFCFPSVILCNPPSRLLACSRSSRSPQWRPIRGTNLSWCTVNVFLW